MRPDGFMKEVSRLQNFSGFFRISGVSGTSRIFPEFRRENSGVFSWFQAVIVCKHFKNARFSGKDFRDFPEFPEISGNFLIMSGISPGFRGENSEVFSRFQAVIVCKPLKNGRFSEDDFPNFPEFPEISGNFPKTVGISPGFRGENSGVF